MCVDCVCVRVCVVRPHTNHVKSIYIEIILCVPLLYWILDFIQAIYVYIMRILMLCNGDFGI